MARVSMFLKMVGNMWGCIKTADATAKESLLIRMAGNMMATIKMARKTVRGKLPCPAVKYTAAGCRAENTMAQENAPLPMGISLKAVF